MGHRYGVNRAAVYGLLTAILVGHVLGHHRRDPGGLSSRNRPKQRHRLISTLAIAALFVPLHRRIQDVINSGIYRRRYDAPRTVTALGAKMHDEVDVERLTAGPWSSRQFSQFTSQCG